MSASHSQVGAQVPTKGSQFSDACYWLIPELNVSREWEMGTHAFPLLATAERAGQTTRGDEQAGDVGMCADRGTLLFSCWLPGNPNLMKEQGTHMLARRGHGLVGFGPLGAAARVLHGFLASCVHCQVNNIRNGAFLFGCSLGGLTCGGVVDGAGWAHGAPLAFEPPRLEDVIHLVPPVGV